MSRTMTCGAVLFAAMLAMSGAIAAAPVSTTAQAGGQVAASDAAPFLGEWTLAMKGTTGPAKYELILKIEKDAVVGDITGPAGRTQRVTDISKPGKSLILRYAVEFMGKAVPTVVTLTPAAEGTLTAQIDFAAGTYVLTGTGAKKDRTK
jgi:hypothetical protein